MVSGDIELEYQMIYGVFEVVKLSWLIERSHWMAPLLFSYQKSLPYFWFSISLHYASIYLTTVGHSLQKLWQQSLIFFCIARVKQKSCKKLVGHNDVHCIQDTEAVEKRPVPVDNEILAIQYQKISSNYQEEEEHGAHQPEENETVSQSIENNDTSSKRKLHDGGVAVIPEIKYTSLFF